MIYLLWSFMVIVCVGLIGIAFGFLIGAFTVKVSVLLALAFITCGWIISVCIDEKESQMWKQ